jgi:hypothetical protein
MRAWKIRRELSAAVGVTSVLLSRSAVVFGQQSADLEAGSGLSLNTSVPEAMSLAVFGLCLLGLSIAARRRKQRR